MGNLIPGVAPDRVGLVLPPQVRDANLLDEGVSQLLAAFDAAPGAPIASQGVVDSIVECKVPEPMPSSFEVAGQSIYMIGIGGSGMQGLARLLRARGANVAGSEPIKSGATDALAAEGIEIGFDQSRSELPARCDLVVASAAIRPDHPQMLAAAERGVSVLNYAEALGRCMLNRTAVCIAGTHGKSTTTSMLSCVLSDCGLKPTSIVGASCAQLGGANAKPEDQAGFGGGFVLGAEEIPLGPKAGKPGLIVAESCEFNRSFHNYNPTVAVITSVEADHLDMYGSVDEVIKSFNVFARRIAPSEEGGLLLIAHDNAHRREVRAGVRAKVQTLGFSPSADWQVKFDSLAREAVLLDPARREVCRWTVDMPGDHNAMNSAFAAAVATHLGCDAQKISASLSAFAGVDRRSQFIGHRAHPLGGVVRIYDDYGHHPTEVEATLRALRDRERPELRNGRLICVFQPHQHSRTRHLLEEFAKSFEAADVVIVPNIYFVRDSVEESQKVTAGDLVDRLRQRGVQAMHLYPFAAITESLETQCRPGDVLVVMGAGPVNEVAYGFLRAGPHTTADGKSVAAGKAKR